MDLSDRPDLAPAVLAKGALRRLAQAKQEPTPANFARAYAEEAGGAAPGDDPLPARARAAVERMAMRLCDQAADRGALVNSLMAGRWDEAQRWLERPAAAAGGVSAAVQAWPELLAQLVQGLERGGRQWTIARRKDGLQRALDAGRRDPARLPQRLQHLLGQWDGDAPDHRPEPADGAQATAPASASAPASELAPVPAAEQGGAPSQAQHPGPAPDSLLAALQAEASPRLVATLGDTLRAGLPAQEPRAQALADELGVLAARIAAEGATPALVDAVVAVCVPVRRLFGVRQELVDELLALARALTDGLTDLAEDASWARGQGQSLRQRLQGPTSARAVRAARELLDQTRQRQASLVQERQQARDALKQMVQQVIGELGALEGATGAFHDRMAGYAQAIGRADSLASLGQLVQEMAGDTQAVHAVVGGARDRLASEHARAAELEARVRGLEAELRRLSDEVGTDALTQVANRRGLQQLFDAERARAERAAQGAVDLADPAGAAGGLAPLPPAGLAVGLIDIDNFKKLNDTLGHAAGDQALKSLAAKVKQALRPVDHVARFGGEEFVVLLPDTPVDEAQQVLTRLQRRLSASLFMHEGKEVFVTFSAGVTAYRIGTTADGAAEGEPLEQALARADEALYEAKRTGKNRTCIG